VQSRDRSQAGILSQVLAISGEAIVFGGDTFSCEIADYILENRRMFR
jgi:hypothetical protein